ncbi:MAG: S8 family serine peptidase [Actinobacteria bacterium]|nr:S8 family serine peptidase [Actinomycetota bacterium]
MRRSAALALALFACAGTAASATAGPPLTVHYSTPAALRGLHVTMRIAPLGIAEVIGADAASLRARAGIDWVEPAVARRHLGSAPVFAAGPPTEWQYAATRANLVPSSVLRAASSVIVAVVDTGADLTAPDIAAKQPLTYSAVTGDTAVTDTVGHGTFVASLAAGATTRNVFDGFGGDAQLMVVQANSNANDFTDATEAAAIVWAVDHGARIVNLSLGGPDTSQTEQDALAYATAHGALIVAAAGNEGQNDNLVTYPAALLGPNGIAVGASTDTGTRAPFSTAAPYVSLLAPGVSVLGALSSTAPTTGFTRAEIGRAGGLFGYGTGTSYAAPQVAGAAALVWAANPALTATQVVQILEQTASRHGTWTAATGYGVLDVASAVARALGRPALGSPPVQSGAMTLQSVASAKGVPAIQLASVR